MKRYSRGQQELEAFAPHLQNERVTVSARAKRMRTEALKEEALAGGLQLLPDLGHQNRRDFFLMVTSLPLVEPHLKATSNGSQMMQPTGSNSQRFKSVLPSAISYTLLFIVFCM